MTLRQANYSSHFLLAPSPPLAMEHCNTTRNAPVSNYAEPKTIRSHVAWPQHFARFRAASCFVSGSSRNPTDCNQNDNHCRADQRSSRDAVHCFVAVQISHSIRTMSAAAAPTGIASHQYDISFSLLREYGVRSCPSNQASPLRFCQREHREIYFLETLAEKIFPLLAASVSRCGELRSLAWRSRRSSANPSASLISTSPARRRLHTRHSWPCSTNCGPGAALKGRG